MRAAGGWLAVASTLLAITLIFHGPPEHHIGDQMTIIAEDSQRWLIVHWIAAALSFFVVAGLVVLAGGSRLTETWWTLSAWAVLSVGALWTITTAVAEATAVSDAAVSGNVAMFKAWWVFSEGMANGFAALALAVAAIAGNEARTTHRVTPVWASGVAIVVGITSFAGWALWSWLDLGLARRSGWHPRSSCACGCSGLVWV